MTGPHRSLRLLPSRFRLHLHLRRRLAVLLALLAAVQAAMVANPAWACGCGALIPGRGAGISVADETSLLRWDEKAGREQITMRLTVHGDAADAAWVMPVPSRAEVDLGDPRLFDELEDTTAPVERTDYHFWPDSSDWPFNQGGGMADGSAGAAPGAPPVGVVDRERLGPFEVARLTASDPDALDDWLRANGYTMPEGMAESLRPYVDKEWEYVAVKLVPDGGGPDADTPLRGGLTPIRLDFAAERPVYPMRLSQRATTPQTLRLYVLAEHRMRTKGHIGGLKPEVEFAGRLEAGEVGPGPLRQELRGGGRYLTALTQEFPLPGRIDGDHTLVRSSTDKEYRRTEVVERLLTVGGAPVWVLSLLGGVLVVVAAVLLLVRRQRRLSRAMVIPG